MMKRVIGAVLMALVIWALPGGPFSGASGSGRTLAAFEPQQKGDQTPPATGESAGMAGMMKQHQQMMAEMHASDVKLDQLVSEMNSATGEAKVAAIARTVSELVNQQKAMHGRMGMMGEMMMKGHGMMAGK